MRVKIIPHMHNRKTKKRNVSSLYNSTLNKAE